MNFFFNSGGRLRSGWRFLIFAALFFVLAMLLAAAAISVFTALGILSSDVSNTGSLFILSTATILFSAVCVGWLCAKTIEGLPFTSLGWSFRKGWWRDLLMGIVLGVGSLLLTAALAALGGGLSFAFNQTADSGAVAKTILSSALIFALGAASEEALFRGYPMQTFARARLSWVAILLTSIFFAFVHMDNPSVSRFGLVNTALAGIWFAAAFLKTRNLWFAFGLHWAWNWTMGAILGIPVSGIERITPHPVLLRVEQGPVWLTGGDYGLEGGAACTVALIVSTALIWFAPFLKPTEEMLALTNRENAKEEKIPIFPPPPPIFGGNRKNSSADNIGDFES